MFVTLLLKGTVPVPLVTVQLCGDVVRGADAHLRGECERSAGRDVELRAVGVLQSQWPRAARDRAADRIGRDRDLGIESRGWTVVVITRGEAQRNEAESER